jgi:type IV pilus assembly protein PilA
MNKYPARIGRHRERQRGFSLIELLIVVAVILIIAAIAIPNFVRSRMRANEAAAVANLRNITTANVAYLTTYGIGYVDDMTKLGGNAVIVDSTAAGLIDEVLAAGNKNGYTYSYTVTVTDPAGNAVGYTLTADPNNVGSTGERHFYTDQTAIIRFSTTAAASSSDTPI